MTRARRPPRPPPSRADSGDSGSNRSLWGDVRYELVRSPVFWVSSILVLVVMLMSFAPFLFASTSPNESGACSLVDARGKPTWDKPFGYTAAGCDMWASLVWGAGKSVNVAILVTIGTVVLGVTTGTAAGWFGGFTDTIISRITDVFFGLPFLLGAIVFLADLPHAQHLDDLAGSDHPRLDLADPRDARKRAGHQATRLRRRRAGARCE